MTSSGRWSTDRRRFLTGSAALLMGASAGWPGRALAGKAEYLPLGPAAAYDFEAVLKTAQTLAAKPYVAPEIPHKALIQTLDFEAYQGIKFNPAMTLWPEAGSPFSVRLFHLGQYFERPVILHVVENGAAREIRYSPETFEYRDPKLAARMPKDLGYAGFRLMEPNGRGDWLSFLGASYFRAAGPGRQYGLSARGLAIGTALPGPEEFPRFSQFWLHRPTPGAEHFMLDALLESESCTGAYRFVISRPDRVVMTVKSTLFIRKDIKRLGIAPLTSMYWYSESDRVRADRPVDFDWRPEVHDSDGLALWTGKGERIWRPLNDPKIHIRVSSFEDDNPKGYGLMQRDRNFDHYQDDGSFYEKRPDVWVEPLEGWQRGAVQLVELPTNNEIEDNIGAFWNPAKPVKAGDRLDHSYKLYWVLKEPFPPPVGEVVATRVGRGGDPGKPHPPTMKRFVVDFAGGPLAKMQRRYDVEAVVTPSRGVVGTRYVVNVVGTHIWRALFDLDVKGTKPVEIRCFLRLHGQALTETWLYQFLPIDFPKY